MYSLCKLAIPILALALVGQVNAVLGGHEAKPHRRPYMVLLEKDKQGHGVTYCLGFLLNEDFVMTAAHCQASSYKVYLGVHNFANSNANIQRIPVAQSFPHTFYNAENYRNDIMLLKLSFKVKFNEYVRPIDMASKNDGSVPKSCLVSGWGRSDRNTPYMSNMLREVNVTLIDNWHCVKEKLYCSEGEAGPGSGDTGGPLVCEDGKAYGVVSYSITEKGRQELRAYAKIPDERSWIESVINNPCMI